MLNRIILMGRLTRDPEIRYTQSQIPVASFSLAVDRDFKGQDGQKETDFIDIVAWRNTAEFVSKYFTKGRMAVVEGRLQIRDWTDRNGGKRRSAEVIADNVYFGDSKRDGDGGQTPYGAPQGNNGQPGYGQPGGGRPARAPTNGYGKQYGQVSAPAQPSYPPSDYGGGFSDMTDSDDGELPF